MTLNSVLDRMESINRRIEHAVHSPDKNLQMLILGLRQDFASQCGDFLKALGEDPRTLADRSLFEELQDMFDEMRTKLAVHQRKWQTVEMHQDYSSYQAATRRVSDAVSTFTREARERLDACDVDGAGPPMLRMQPMDEQEKWEDESSDLSLGLSPNVNGAGQSSD